MPKRMNSYSRLLHHVIFHLSFAICHFSFVVLREDRLDVVLMDDVRMRDSCPFSSMRSARTSGPIIPLLFIICSHIAVSLSSFSDTRSLCTKSGGLSAARASP